MFAHEWAREKECVSSAFVWILSSPMLREALFVITFFFFLVGGGRRCPPTSLLTSFWRNIYHPPGEQSSYNMDEHLANNKLTPPPFPLLAPFWLLGYLSSPKGQLVNNIITYSEHSLDFVFNWSQKKYSWHLVPKDIYFSVRFDVASKNFKAQKGLVQV